MFSRNEFGELLALMDRTGVAVEVGVLHGEFSKILYDGCMKRGKRFGALYLIDPWKHYGGQVVNELEAINADYEKCFQEVNEFVKDKPEIHIVRGVSPEEANRSNLQSIDFVYLDALHDYKSVKADIAAWWPRIRKGGILAGHDYTDEIGHVKTAVDEFLDMGWRKYILNLTTNDGPYYSWWIIK
jgi:hypothetical protein